MRQVSKTKQNQKKPYIYVDLLPIKTISYLIAGAIFYLLFTEVDHVICIPAPTIFFLSMHAFFEEKSLTLYHNDTILEKIQMEGIFR